MKKKFVIHVGVLAAILGFSMAFLSAFSAFFPEPFSRSKSEIFMHAVYWNLCFYLIWLILKKPTEAYLVSPKIKNVLPSGIVLVKNAPWLSMHVSVAVYVLEGEFERLICIGRVLNVQSNHLVQIELVQDSRGMINLSEVVVALQQADKEKILLKPGLYVE